MATPIIDPAKVEFCRALKETAILDSYFSREQLFEAIDKLIERRIAEAFNRAIQELDKI